MSENKKIAINSGILYLRLIVTTIIGLYTSRIILLQLGANDYGLYTVVGGIISMMNFLNTTMLATTYRFIAVEIGKGEKGNPNKIFNTSFVIHLALTIVLVIIAETGGVWYIHNYLNVAAEKIPEALFVLHTTVIATIFTIVSIPFQGLITAKEKFIIRAGVEIVRALLKLGLILLLVYYTGNKLRAYSIIMIFVMIIPPLLFYLYSRLKEYEIIKWKFNKNKEDYINMLNFSGWVVIGAGAHIGVRQGAAILINLFFGTVVNAAFGIASQVYNYIQMFVNNLNQAAVPQIMKSHSAGNNERSMNLVYSMSKYAFFLMLFPAVPILLSMDIILKLWLKEVPEYTSQFANIMIINGLIAMTGSGFDAAIQATGDIRKMQIWFSSLMLLSLPIAYVLFLNGLPPYYITIILLGATIVMRVVSIRILSELTSFKVGIYLKRTILPVLLVSILIIPQYFIRKFFAHDLMGTIIFSLISIILIIPNIYYLGLNKEERRKIINGIKNIYLRVF